MTYDIALRYQQALDPSALVTIGTTLHAIKAAITDCQNAGKNLETDPAITLLVRHFAAVCAERPSDAQLRRDCMEEIARLRRQSPLKTLAYRGVAYDEAAKRLFHTEGRAAMRRLADALELAEGSFDIRSNKAGPAVSGEVTLHGEDLWVQLSLGPYGPDRELCYRSVQGRSDHIGGRNHWAPVRDLLAPERFAARLVRDLRLERRPARRLVA
ncbi:MAG: hypothetical protein QHC67_15215 [Sphingobium sp.]|uniref:hypothetical protein n=1 Tax=Sphingobium sp. TaxID=1912891 RepID=UPI0029BAC660|nr:hypothetical protein [Sphingobium sp.]MDX3911148.1 hypothetical protein [Sphingobium sp.]